MGVTVGRAPGKYLQWRPFYITEIPLYEHTLNLDNALLITEKTFVTKVEGGTVPTSLL